MSDDGLSDCFDEPNMEIQIDTLTGTSFDMRVSSNDTIREIKQRIQRVEGIPIQQQNLIFESKELKDSRRLCDAGIKNGSTIKLVLAMRGGPISTRRLSVSCDHHLMLKELKELLENTRDEIGNKLAAGSKVSVLVFKEGDILNLLRVVENEDGSYSPYGNEKTISPPTTAAAATITTTGATSFQQRHRTTTSTTIRQQNEKLVEDMDMMTKIACLRKKMENLNLRRRSRRSRNNNDGNGDDDDNDNDDDDDDDDYNNNDNSRNNGHQMRYKLLSNSDLYGNTDLKIFQREEESQSEEEIALKDKHRIKAIRKRELKSLYSENKGAFSHTKATYVRIHRKANNLQPASTKQQQQRQQQRSNVRFTRFVLDNPKTPPASSPTLELDNESHQWEIHDSLDRFKSTTTCNVGLLKRRKSIDFKFDDKDELGGGAAATASDSASAGADIFSNLYVPDIPINYKTSPIYERKNNECKIERLKNDDICSGGGGGGGSMSSSSSSSNDLLYEDRNYNYNYDFNYGYDYNFGLLTTTGTTKTTITKNKEDNKDNKKQIDEEINKLPPITIKKKSRCNECNKRLNITNIYNCRCGKIFCSQHRYSELHKCNYDYKSEGKRILQQQNPLIAASKINRI